MSVKSKDVLRAWGRILAGRRPSLSIEITRECPLRCPGCYAYEDGHLGNGINLRQLSDKKGDALVQGVLEIVDEHRPLHLSIVGGDPLVRYREVDTLLPLLAKRGIHVNLVTSAFREIPRTWSVIPRFSIVISVDGLQPEHDARRKPATYERILKNIQGHHVTIHCTVTGQMMQRPSYLPEFLEFWSAKKEVRRMWISLFTPQKGAVAPEILSLEQRRQVVEDLLRLRALHPKLDMAAPAIREFLSPPMSPQECIFARTTTVISADLRTRIVPCQFGGDPDCSQCGCAASMGLAAIGHRRLGLGITPGSIMTASMKVGSAVKKVTGRQELQRPRHETPTTISWQSDPVETEAPIPIKIDP